MKNNSEKAWKSWRFYFFREYTPASRQVHGIPTRLGGIIFLHCFLKLLILMKKMMIQINPVAAAAQITHYQ
jgi:hypothetical protein